MHQACRSYHLSCGLKEMVLHGWVARQQHLFDAGRTLCLCLCLVDAPGRADSDRGDRRARGPPCSLGIAGNFLQILMRRLLLLFRLQLLLLLLRLLRLRLLLL